MPIISYEQAANRAGGKPGFRHGWLGAHGGVKSFWSRSRCLVQQVARRAVVRRVGLARARQLHAVGVLATVVTCWLANVRRQPGPPTPSNLVRGSIRRPNFGSFEIL